MIDELPGWQKKLVLRHDTEAEELLAQRGKYKQVLFADCQGMVNNDLFIQMVKDILGMLQEVYGRPVDVEFAVNSMAKGEWELNLLQCRPLQASISEKIHIPEEKVKEFLFDVRRTSMRRSKMEKLDIIVWVDPRKYYEYPYAKKFHVAQKIDEINRHYEETDNASGSRAYRNFIAGTGSSGSICQHQCILRHLRGSVQRSGISSGTVLWKPYVPGSCGG